MYSGAYKTDIDYLISKLNFEKILIQHDFELKIGSEAHYMAFGGLRRGLGANFVPTKLSEFSCSRPRK